MAIGKIPQMPLESSPRFSPRPGIPKSPKVDMPWDTDLMVELDEAENFGMDGFFLGSEVGCVMLWGDFYVIFCVIFFKNGGIIVTCVVL